MAPNPSSSSTFNPACGLPPSSRVWREAGMVSKFLLSLPMSSSTQSLPEESPLETSLPAPPSRAPDGKLEQVLLLGQERKYSFFPPLSKNMLRAFLRLDAIKNSCGSKHPRSLRLGRLKTKNTLRRQIGACPSAGSTEVPLAWSGSPGTPNCPCFLVLVWTLGTEAMNSFLS